MNWATHLEHLQIILQEFNVVYAFNKDLMIKYFRDGFRPSIYAQLNEKDKDQKNW